MTVWVGISAVVVLGLLVALATWRGSLIAGVVPMAGCVLAVTVVGLARRTLRRESALIDTILREELDSDPAVSRAAGKRPNLSA